MCVREREREGVCVCVCVRERERERVSVIGSVVLELLPIPSSRNSPVFQGHTFVAKMKGL